MTYGEKTPIPEFGTRLDGINYIDRPGAYAVIENDANQLALIETGIGYFLPGGGVESGETEVDALKREIREEIGYEARVLAEIGETVEYLEARREEKYYQICSRFYRAQLGPKIGRWTEQDHRLVWVSREEAAKLLTRQGQAWVVEATAKG